MYTVSFRSGILCDVRAIDKLRLVYLSLNSVIYPSFPFVNPAKHVRLFFYLSLSQMQTAITQSLTFCLITHSARDLHPLLALRLRADVMCGGARLLHRLWTYRCTCCRSIIQPAAVLPRFHTSTERVTDSGRQAGSRSLSELT